MQVLHVEPEMSKALSKVLDPATADEMKGHADAQVPVPLIKCHSIPTQGGHFTVPLRALAKGDKMNNFASLCRIRTVLYSCGSY